ncbi:MAG: AAA family ATPase [Gammaproteobacteria bacterium]|nr:AAA family ATPase [Gammaproteobacteria bacterium]
MVLVDEYDKPVLDVLEDDGKARANRNCLREIYSIIKSSEDHIRFVFVTGITMFSKTSFSSGLNNLTDISLSPRHAAICGYTDHDLETVFAPELEGLDREMIRTWYNGYSWLGAEKLYNPHDILHLFNEHEYRAHWFRSGEPGCLYRLLMERRVSPMQLENRVVDADLISNFELGEFPAVPVRVSDDFQKGTAGHPHRVPSGLSELRGAEQLQHRAGQSPDGARPGDRGGRKRAGSGSGGQGLSGVHGESSGPAGRDSPCLA